MTNKQGMLERVSRAICAVDGDQDPDMLTDPNDDPAWTHYTDFAKAAIDEYEKAIAEKTECRVVYTKDGVYYFSGGLAQQDEPLTYVKYGIAAFNSPLSR